VRVNRLRGCADRGRSVNVLCIQKGTMKQPPVFRSAAQCIERLYPFICIGRLGLRLFRPQYPISAHRQYPIHAPHHSFRPRPRPQQLGGVVEPRSLRCRDRDVRSKTQMQNSVHPCIQRLHMEPSSQKTGEKNRSRDLPRVWSDRNR
jgi:hypothetical protein